MAERQSLLIVDDDTRLAEMLSEYFGNEGFEVSRAEWGADAVRLCWEAPPSLALLDIHLPDITGYDVARRLQAHRRTRDIPLIFLTSRKGREDRLQGLELGAVDYISKPFDLQELTLRVRNILRRATTQTVFHPITNLPEGQLVDEQLSQMLLGRDWAALVITLRGLNQFRETYGFVAADDVLRAVGLRLRNAVGEADARVDFLGQLDPENYLIATRAPYLRNLQRELQTFLSQSMDIFYALDDQLEAVEEPLGFETRLLSAATTPFADVSVLKLAVLEPVTK